MAYDWIKMRTDLYRDPKVCVIADKLMAPTGELAAYVNQHCQCDMAVTRNVMRNVTVGALLSVWGVMRNSGKRVGDDLLREQVTIKVLDDIADIPGFGEAMVASTWVRETPEGLVFPNFFADHNVDPIESSQRKNAERQQRYRDRHRNGDDNATSDVTVTGRVEQSRAEVLDSLPLMEPVSQKQNQNPNKAARRKFIPPTIEEVTAFVTQRKSPVNPKAFVAFYDSKNWRVGNQPMVKWKQAVITWEEREKKSAKNSAVPTTNGLDLKRQAMERLSK